MSDFTDLVSRAINPAMTREERNAVYRVVKQALQALQEREGQSPSHPHTALQQHLVEETIRDVELDIARILSMQKLERAFAAQDVGNGEAG